MSGFYDTERRVGVNQSWQDMTASRALSTVYTNTTGRPIVVSVSTANGATASARTVYLYVNGHLVAPNVSPQTSDSPTKLVSAQAVVPNGATYENSGNSLGEWWELR